jgi:hypothetical protein
MSKKYTDKEIEQLKMKARLMDAIIRQGRITSEQLKEYNEVLGILRDLRVEPWEG